MKPSDEPAPDAALAAVLVSCCEELVGTLAPAPNDDAEIGALANPVVSFIELSGGDIEATLVARFECTFLAQTHPRRQRRLTNEDCAGWASEILNQVAGRFVNKLGRRGVTARIGIPGSLLGPNVSLHLGEGTPEVFARPGLALYLALDELRRPLKSVADDDATRHEGELVLF